MPAPAPDSPPSPAPDIVLSPPRPPRPPEGAPRELADDEYTDGGYSDCEDYEEQLLAFEAKKIEYEIAMLEIGEMTAPADGEAGGADGEAAPADGEAGGTEEGGGGSSSLDADASRGALEVSDDLLGEGATAQVWRGHYGTSRREVAAKVVRKGDLDEEEIGWVREEIRIHRTLDHTNVCRLFDALETPTSITLVLQLCEGGSLVDTMVEAAESGVPMRESTVRSATKQMLSALSYCQSVGVVHRDVKMANLCWVDAEATWLVLTDFGFASTKDAHSSYAGSAHFAAPEVHRADAGEVAPYSAAAADVWSAGVVLFSMLATQLPFGGEEESEEEQRALRDKVCAAKLDLPLVQLRRGAPAKELVRKMLVADPAKRATLDEALGHAWLSG